MAVDGRLIAGISILVAVVEGGSFTRAGELLGLSASGVSRAITRLEERVGVRLLDRTTRTLRLTDEGSRLYELATPHLEGVEEATAIARGAAASVRGMLRVSANPIFARHILAPHLSEFIARYPDLRLTILQQSDVGDLIGDGIDVAIRFGPQPPSTISSRHLLDTRVLTVASPDYLAGRGRPGSPADLAGHQCLEFIDPRSGQVFEWEFHKDGDVLPVMKAGALTFTDVDTMVAACLAGTGIAQVLELGAEKLLENGDLVELFPDWPGETFPLYAVRPSRRLSPAKVTAFIDFCTEIACRRSDQLLPVA
jgi:DNA-binding transcriptional LysR family regulator